ncbi:MAG: PilZ domain-containing protein, partial [Kofleriaceae bacterium]
VVAHQDREHPRYAHEAVVRIRVGGAEYEGRTTNLSRGGLCADMATKIPYGSEVDLDIQLVFEEDVQSEPLTIHARVVWSTAVDEGFQIGLAFKPMRAEQSQYLTMFLRYLDDSGPKGKQPKAERSVDDQFR